MNTDNDILFKLVDTYLASLEAIEKAPRGRFLPSEVRATKEVIARNDYDLNLRFSVMRRNMDFCKTKDGNDMQFVFRALPKDLQECDPALSNFFAAHEVRHAGLAYSQSHGYHHINIASLTFGALLLRDKAAQKTKQYRSNLVDITNAYRWDRKKELCDPRFYYHSIMHSVCTFAHSGLNLLYAKFSRYEERKCDEFALRCFPEMDLKKFRNFLTVDEKTNGPRDVNCTRQRGHEEVFTNEASTVTKSALRLHPMPQERYNYLVKMQKALALTLNPAQPS